MSAVSTTNMNYYDPYAGQQQMGYNQNNYYGGAQQPHMNTGGIVPDTYTDTSGFSKIGSIVATVGGGGFVAYKLGGQMAKNIGNIFGGGNGGQVGAQLSAQAGKSAQALLTKGSKGLVSEMQKTGATTAKNLTTQAGKGGLFSGVGGVVMTGLKGAGLGALVGAGLSAVTNGVGVATGQVSSSRAVDNVIGDTIGGAVGGLGAVTAAGIGGMILGKMGVAGLPLTIATIALGAAGGVAGMMAKDALLD